MLVEGEIRISLVMTDTVRERDCSVCVEVLGLRSQLGACRGTTCINSFIEVCVIDK